MKLRQGILILFLLTIAKAFVVGNMSNIQDTYFSKNVSVNTKSYKGQLPINIKNTITKTSLSEIEFDEDSSDDDLFDTHSISFVLVISRIDSFQNLTCEFFTILQRRINFLYILFLQFLI